MITNEQRLNFETRIAELEQSNATHMAIAQRRGKFIGEQDEKIAELTRVIADLRGALTTISRAQQNAVSFRDLCVYAKKAVAGIVEEKCPQD